MNLEQNKQAAYLAHLDERGDLAPPWEKFPHYERYTIGWRMGTGEYWMDMWHDFIGQMPPDVDVRLAYLHRHAPAPYSWAKLVQQTLYPLLTKDEGESNESEAHQNYLSELLAQGLIASDIAYRTWLAGQNGIHWPWEHGATPEEAARYATRDLWFWSRQIAELRTRADWQLPTIPLAWITCSSALQEARLATPDLKLGLLTLAQMLSANQLIPPWQLGLQLCDFADSYEDDMGFVDAFRLWGMSVFDDSEHLRSYLEQTQAPAEWQAWASEHFMIDLG